ncbi:MAG TPA: hypothetical protein PLT03_01150 [Bacillota bacterium]|nr:hypothetical protein [Bacillota bacterium]HOA14744.1 hypothetical protein [Bacillota bacterium]HOG52459.1 hypothetical protein [Bacillota bacterium]
MKRTTVILVIAIALSLSLAAIPAEAADWKLTDASAAEYKKLATPEKEIAEKWLATLPASAYKESFTQLVMGLVVWVSREPISFLDYEFVKLFKTTGEKVDIYTFKAGDAKMVTDIYSPPVIPGDL